MPRIVIIILIYHRHKPIDPICPLSDVLRDIKIIGKEFCDTFFVTLKHSLYDYRG
jgi:hypothetical protein